MKKQKMNKGITLIALIITIIVLLILAVVAISSVKGEEIIAHAKNAKSQYSEAQTNEQDMLSIYEEELEKGQGTYREYVINKELNEKYAGLKLGDKVNYTVPTGKTYSGEWRVLEIENGQIKLVATTNVETKTLAGDDTTLGIWDETTASYKNAEDALDTICAEYLNTAQATIAKSIRAEDIDKITGYDKTTYGEGHIYQYGNKVTYSINANGKVEYSSAVKSGTSEQTTFRKPQGTTNITSPYTVTSNFYYYDVDGETELKNKASNAYQMLFGNDNQIYWLASSFVDTSNAGFGVRCVYNGYLSGSTLWIATRGKYSLDYGIRPVIYLNSNAKLTETTAGSGIWNIG